MAAPRKKRKTGKKKKRSRRKKKSSFIWTKWLGFAIAFAIGAVAAFYFLSIGGFLPQTDSTNATKVKRPAPTYKVSTPTIPKASEKPQKKTPQPVEPPKKKRPVNIVPTEPSLPPLPESYLADNAPAVAIIIDDLGLDIKAASRLLRLDRPIAFSVLPYLRYSRTVATRAHNAGMVVMLHLPMEAKGRYARPGPGALLVGMDADTILETLKGDLGAVPHITGVNNHMGSLFTERGEKLGPVLDELAKRSLFFVDSRTTTATVGQKLAHAKKIKTNGRDIFLDNSRNVEKISVQLAKLVRKAKRDGSAIGIGHPYPETITALEKNLPEIEKMGVRIVPVTALLK